MIINQTERWNAASIKESKKDETSLIVDRIIANKQKYIDVDNKVQIPWYWIAAIHNMESGGDFKCHLHEGSLLTDRTKYVPKGRPKTGEPPFTWEESAIDALTVGDGEWLSRVDWSKKESTLYSAEKYNGLGYILYHQSVPTPYLWAGTTIEKVGKYGSDGRWNPQLSSKQIGVATIFKMMEIKKLINFDKLK